MFSEKKIKEVNLGSTLARPARGDAYHTKKLELDVREDAAALVMGSIVEKDVSGKSTSTPNPTILPFPVARHRSSGPHWNPARVDEKMMDVEVDPDISVIDSLSSFAHPVQRKQKAALSLKQLKETILGNYSSEVVNAKEESKAVQRVRAQLEKLTFDNLELRNDRSCLANEPSFENDADSVSSSLPSFPGEMGGRSLARLQSEFDTENNLRSHEMSSEEIAEENMVSSSRTSFPNGVGANSLASLQNEIDAENNLRLQEMSPEEIAEAKTEIKEKMNPSLLNFLRNRGLSKQMNASVFYSNSRQNFKTESDKLKSKSLNVDNSLKMSSIAETTSSLAQSSSTSNIAQSTIQKLSTWNSWTQRVEAVRKLRFSMEGTVLTDTSETDNLFINHQLSADNVAERDILRSEGDPAAAGYTIQEAVQLTRSVIPGQRSLALHLLASLISRSLNGLQKIETRCSLGDSGDDVSTDWEAVWAYVLGPEPVLSLALRLCLDDNHNLVVFTCAKVIHSILTCDMNKDFFHISEKIPSQKDSFTAPIFRSKPEMETGFIHGGHWKYSAKPSTIFNISEDAYDDDTEGKHTIHDDVVVASQDFVAGLVRMGLLQKLCYLLENEPSPSMEEYISAIIVSIARHSPTCADAVFRCPELINVIVERFTAGGYEDINYAILNYVCLLKVLAQVDRKNCLEFIKKGYFQRMTSNLYQPFCSLDQWKKLGKGRCNFLSVLLIEQLRFWRVCIHQGCCLSYFQNIFSTLILWLTPPSFKNFLDSDLVSEFTSLSAEAYLVLGSLARKLPKLHNQDHNTSENEEANNWSWKYVTPVVDLALMWLTFKNDPSVSMIFTVKEDNANNSRCNNAVQCSLLWAFTSVFHFFSTLLERITPEEDRHSTIPWLPEFVPKVGLEIIKERFFTQSELKESFVEVLCCLREQDKDETSLASTCCLLWLLRTVSSVDILINLARSQTVKHSSGTHGSSWGARLLEEGIQQGCSLELNSVFDTYSRKFSSEWLAVQSIELFGRGGPAPGVGVGWGVPGGGFWSNKLMLTRQDSEILFHLLTNVTEMSIGASNCLRINLILAICLTFGPGDRALCHQAFDVLFGVSVLKKLGGCVQQFFHSRGKLGDWDYTDDEYAMFSRRLSFHYTNHWLSSKRKSNASSALKTIPEDMGDESCVFETTEWANQRLPLPIHWLCSSIATVPGYKNDGSNLLRNSDDAVEIAKSGLFFLLGAESLSSFVSAATPSPVRCIPLIWKLHSLSASLVREMTVIEDEKSSDTFEALQFRYGEFIDEERTSNDQKVEFMRFQSEVHESYSTFVEILVEQFAAESYGHLLFGRQVAVYLHRGAEAAVRHAAWNALSNARVLDILPPMEKCMGKADGYLFPNEDDDSILEAYAKSWVSGALDRAASRGSMAYTLALHHIASFIFAASNHNIVLRNKVVKLLLRDSSSSPRRQGMMLDLIRYDGGSSRRPTGDKFNVLADACETDSSLLLLLHNLAS